MLTPVLPGWSAPRLILSYDGLAIPFIYWFYQPLPHQTRYCALHSTRNDESSGRGQPPNRRAGTGLDAKLPRDARGIRAPRLSRWHGESIRSATRKNEAHP